jgi:hypothetical protein
MQTFDYSRENDSKYVMEMISEDYKNYLKIPYNFRTNLIVALQALYQCKTQISNDENKDEELQKKILNGFRKLVVRESGIDIRISTKDGFRIYVPQQKKSKRKIKNVIERNKIA